MNFLAQIPADISTAHDQIMLGLVALLGTLIATFAYVVRNGGYAKTAASESRAANHAVNNIGPEKEHTLYKLVEKIAEKQEEFDKKWGNLPDEIDDAVGLVELLHAMHSRIEEVHKDLLEHVTWEMEAKYKETR
jgi:hypothetical protein